MSRFGLQKLYIHGAYVDSTAGKTFNAINPANGEVLAEVQSAGAEDVDRAVASAAGEAEGVGGDDGDGAFTHPASRGGYSARAQR